MPAIALVPYSIRIKRRNSREDEPIDNFSDKAEDLLSFTERVLSELSEKDWRDENGQALLSITRIEPDQEARTITGVLETGQYGVASRIKDVVRGGVVHLKQRTHADMLPFYFLARLPIQRTKGIVILQTRGVAGVAGIFREALNNSLRALFPDYKIHLRALTNRAVFDKFLAGNLREMRFVRFHLPKGIEDAYEKGHEEIKGRTEYIVRPRRRLGIALCSDCTRHPGRESRVY